MSLPVVDNEQIENAALSSSVQVVVRLRPLFANANSAKNDEDNTVHNKRCIEILPPAHEDPLTGYLPSIHQEQHQEKSKFCAQTLRILDGVGHRYTFDEAFSESTTQREVYERRVSPLVESCLEGYNATILAYGQTGSGKTHTIMGSKPSTETEYEELSREEEEEEEEAEDMNRDNEFDGMIPRAVKSLFDRLEQRLQTSNSEEGKDPESEEDQKETEDNVCQLLDYQVHVQFLEIYGEEIRDLLSPSHQNRQQQPHHNKNNTSSSKLVIRDVGVEEPEVVGATRIRVKGFAEVIKCVNEGMHRRATAATAMNEQSSRSHAILSLLVQQTTTTSTSTATADIGEYNSDDAPRQVKRSKFNFVDLAGSERLKRIRARGQRMKEMIDINQGLLVLGNVIKALGDPSCNKGGGMYVPYRHSKLTRLLKGSLGGNHKTLMVVCVSPSRDDMEETLNCLRYANRAKNIQNHAIANIDRKGEDSSQQVAQLQKQLQALASDLLRAKQGDMSGGIYSKEYVEFLANGRKKDSLSVAVSSALASPSLSSIDESWRSWKDDTDAADTPSADYMPPHLTPDYASQLSAKSDCGSQVCTKSTEVEFQSRIEKLQEELRWAKERLNLQMMKQHHDDHSHCSDLYSQCSNPQPHCEDTVTDMTEPSSDSLALASVPSDISYYEDYISDLSSSGRGSGKNTHNAYGMIRTLNSSTRPLTTLPDRVHGRPRSYSMGGSSGRGSSCGRSLLFTPESDRARQIHSPLQCYQSECEKEEKEIAEDSMFEDLDDALRQAKEEKTELIEKLQLTEKQFSSMEAFYRQQLKRMKQSSKEKDVTCSNLADEIQRLQFMHQHDMHRMEKRLLTKNRHIHELREEQRHQMEQNFHDHENMQREVDNLTSFLRKKIAELVSTKQKQSALQQQLQLEQRESEKTINELRTELHLVKEELHQKLLEEEEQKPMADDYSVDSDSDGNGNGDGEEELDELSGDGQKLDPANNSLLRRFVNFETRNANQMNSTASTTTSNPPLVLVNQNVHNAIADNNSNHLDLSHGDRIESLGLDSSSRGGSISNTESSDKSAKQTLEGTFFISSDDDECLSRLSRLSSMSGVNLSPLFSGQLSLSSSSHGNDLENTAFQLSNTGNAESNCFVLSQSRSSTISSTGSSSVDGAVVRERIVRGDSSGNAINAFLPTSYYYNRVHNNFNAVHHSTFSAVPAVSFHAADKKSQ